MAEPFHTKRRVEFVDTDMAGLVHFSNYFRWMEAAEGDFLRARGLSVKLSADERRFTLPRVSATCDFLKPIRFQDVIDIAVTVDRLGAKSITYAFEFTLGGEPVARGKVTAVCCQVNADKSIEAIEIPAALRERLLA